MVAFLQLRRACLLLVAAVLTMSFSEFAIAQDRQDASSFDYGPATKLRENLSSNAEAIDRGIQAKQPTAIDKAVTSARNALGEYPSPTAEEINSLAAALAARVNAYSGDKASVQASITLLEDAIAASQGVRNVAFVADRADKVRTWVAGADWQQGSSMRQFADLSEQLFRTMRVIDPVSAATALSKAAELVATKPTDDFRFPLEMPAVQSQFVAARKLLDDKVRSADPSIWLVAVGAAADELLVDQTRDTADIKQGRAATIKRLQNIPEAMAAAVKAKAALEKLGDGFRPMLHVIQAYYGDIYQGGNPRRNCDATETMISRCEREQSCSLPEDYRTSLCGYDPIPAADDRTRGVAVSFSCQVGGDDVWDELARYRTIDPDNGSDLTSYTNPARRSALIRGAKMEIRCPTDAPVAK